MKHIWNRCFSFKKFQGTNASLFRARQRISYLEKAPSFLRVGLFGIFPKEQRAGAQGHRQPLRPARHGANAAARPTPGQTRVCCIFPRYKKESISPGLSLPPPPPALPPVQRSSFALYFQSCSLPAARFCPERSSRFAPSFCNCIRAKIQNQTISKIFSFYFKRGHFSRESASLGTSGRDFPALRSHEPVVKNKSKAGNPEKGVFVFRRCRGGFLVVKLNL